MSLVGRSFSQEHLSIDLVEQNLYSLNPTLELSFDTQYDGSALNQGQESAALISNLADPAGSMGNVLEYPLVLTPIEPDADSPSNVDRTVHLKGVTPPGGAIETQTGSLLNQAISLAEDQLRSFIQSDDLAEDLQMAFGEDVDVLSSKKTDG